MIAAVLLSFPAWAQGLPARNDCDTITKELSMRPPAGGDKSRASYDYQSYLGFCKTDPWAGIVSPNDLEALKSLVCEHGGFVDSVNKELHCW